MDLHISRERIGYEKGKNYYNRKKKQEFIS
jgi:hypothetical protein